jgi:hypothetical protein
MLQIGVALFEGTTHSPSLVDKLARRLPKLIRRYRSSNPLVNDRRLVNLLPPVFREAGPPAAGRGG